MYFIFKFLVDFLHVFYFLLGFFELLKLMNFPLSLFGGKFLKIKLQTENGLYFFERFFMFLVDIFELFFKFLVFFLQFFIQNDFFLVLGLFWGIRVVSSFGAFELNILAPFCVLQRSQTFFKIGVGGIKHD